MANYNVSLTRDEISLIHTAIKSRVAENELWSKANPDDQRSKKRAEQYQLMLHKFAA